MIGLNNRRTLINYKSINDSRHVFELVMLPLTSTGIDPRSVVLYALNGLGIWSGERQCSNV
jgi:hypothetical protein